jgi:hypothetical protein
MITHEEINEMVKRRLVRTVPPVIGRLTSESWTNIAKDEVTRATGFITRASVEALVEKAVRRAVGTYKAYTAGQIRQLAKVAAQKKCGSTVKAVLHALAKDIEG